MTSPIQQPLFSNAEGARTAFDNWLAAHHTEMRTSTVRVYRAMWNKFCTYLDAQAIDLEKLQPDHVTSFLAQLQDAKRLHRIRYQNLLERACADIVADVQRAKTNPAARHRLAESPVEWTDAPLNDPKQFLSAGSRRRLIEVLQQEAERTVIASHDITDSARWRQLRAIALVTVFTGAGLRQSEARPLSVNGIFSDQTGRTEINTAKYEGLTMEERRGGLQLDPVTDATHAHQGEGVGIQRTIQLEGWAAGILGKWLIVRAGSPSGAPSASPARLFPSARSYTTARPNTLMDPATITHVVADWGKKYAQMSITPQRLRNTYGAHLLETGADLVAVEKSMGYAPGAASAFRLHAAWLAWKASG